MPDLRYCVKRKGKVYCWDSEKRAVVEVVVRDVPLTAETMEVVADIMSVVISGQTEMPGAPASLRVFPDA
jgi:hypothetical protein